MAYFHSRYTKTIGGRRRIQVRRVVGETLEEMRRVSRLWPDKVWINWPSRSPKAIRGKSGIRMFVDAGDGTILEDLQSVAVSENHVKLLTCLLRKKFFERYLTLDDGDRHWLDTQIRGTLHQLLKNGDWVDNPESLSLENLNRRLEKFDLGRRSDLNFSSTQSLEGRKYDLDVRREDLEDVPAEDDLDYLYRTGTPAQRQDLWNSKPWLHKRWLEAGFGEP